VSRVLLVDTIPKGFRRSETLNPGLEIVRSILGAEVVHFAEEVDLEGVETIGFNVYYPLHLVNAVAFLRRHGLAPGGAGPRLVAGGQGVSNLGGIADPFFDEIFLGELDGAAEDRHGWRRLEVLDSPPVVKNGKAIVEVTRGCRYRCRFCEYGWRLGGSYREKPLELVKAQLEEVAAQGIGSVNLFSMNLGGYRRVGELLEHATRLGLRVLNTDSCLADARKLEPIVEEMSCLRLGVESLDETTRLAMGKKVSDEDLEGLLRWAFSRVGYVYLYLIFGLPGDDFGKWWEWLPRIQRLRDAATRVEGEGGLFPREVPAKIRLDFSITPFEPSPGTPLEDAPRVDYQARADFLEEWVSKSVEAGLRPPPRTPGAVTGRFGRGELSYRLLMALKTAGPEAAEPLARTFPSGLSGSSIPRRATERFLEEIGA